MTVPFATADVARTASVNGRSLALGSAAPHDSLLDWLRSQGLTGAKEGCAEGECGACAVLVARPRADGAEGSQWVALNACLAPAHAFAGQEIVTTEGLGTPTDLHPVQAAMAADGGSQCGYCTPGFVCSMAAEYYRPGRGATPAEAAPDAQAGEHDEHALSGNLCRCTGYRPILEAMAAVGSPADADPFVARGAQPPPTAIAVDVQAAGQRFVRPASLDEALALLSEHPDAVPVAGATDLGVQVNLAFSRPPLLVALDRLAELRTLQVGDTELVLGAGLTLTEIEQRTAGRIPLLDLLWPQFASRLIRNAATLGGNLGTASPIGDSAPALLALDAVLVLASSHGTREVALTDYFTATAAPSAGPTNSSRPSASPCPPRASQPSTRSPSAASTTSPGSRSPSGSTSSTASSRARASASAAWPPRRSAHARPRPPSSAARGTSGRRPRPARSWPPRGPR